MSKERYLEQEINKDLKILDLERKLEELKKENTQLKEMREHLKWKDETRKEKERLERQLEEIMTGLTLIESSLINLRPRDKSPIDRRFGDLIKDIVQLKEQG